MFDGITVLMPVYNGEAFLKEAIDSILAQTYKDFEFLIVDDGSTDKSLEIITAYDDSRIRLVQNENNRGITHTLNKGIELSTFELIARMDADDVCLPQRLQKQFDFFHTKPELGLLATWAREFATGQKDVVYELNPDYYFYNLPCECWIYHPTVMYRKSAVEAAGKYQYPFCEDYDLWWRLSRRYEMAVLPEVLLNYRSTDNSLSRITKRDEYEQAHREQLVRNVYHYTGNKLSLTNEDIDFLMLYFDTITQKNGIDVFKVFFKKLELIDACIFEKEKERYPVDQLQKAAFDKKDRIAYKLLHYYNLREVVRLLIQSGYWQLAYKYAAYGISKKLNR